MLIEGVVLISAKQNTKLFCKKGSEALDSRHSPAGGMPGLKVRPQNLILILILF